MKKLLVAILAVALAAQPQVSTLAKSAKRVTLTKAVLKDKIRGGWAGQTIGCAYGGPTEFRYRGVMIPDSVAINYPEHHLQYYYDHAPGLYDDIYMDLTFVEVFHRLGLDAPVDSFATAFAYAPYPCGTPTRLAATTSAKASYRRHRATGRTIRTPTVSTTKSRAITPA